MVSSFIICFVLGKYSGGNDFYPEVISGNCFISASAGWEILLEAVPDLMSEVIVPQKRRDVAKGTHVKLTGIEMPGIGTDDTEINPTIQG